MHPRMRSQRRPLFDESGAVRGRRSRMAEITVTGVSDWISRGVMRTIWANFNSTGNGTQLEAPNLPDKTVTVYGTYVSGGATGLLQGAEVGGAGVGVALQAAP